jgi:hypothetical protein
MEGPRPPHPSQARGGALDGASGGNLQGALVAGPTSVGPATGPSDTEEAT